MALLEKSDLLQRYNARQSTLLSEGGERRYAMDALLKASRTFDVSMTYDVFLSHSFDDARIVKTVKEMIEEKGHSVYVDWIEDDHLHRGEVSEKTARILRERMDRCFSLVYLTSPSAERSLWMPWELGYMDARTGKIVIAPILEANESFQGREYLGLYPYFDLTLGQFYVHRSSSEWVNFDRWLAGESPKASS